VVGTTGFEPATPASRTLCSTRLSHVPTHLLFYDSSAQLSIKNNQIMSREAFFSKINPFFWPPP
jgi:hypothetical protein